MRANDYRAMRDKLKAANAEIERLKNPKCVNIVHARSLGKTQTLYGALYREAIKEFAEKLKDKEFEIPVDANSVGYLLGADDIDNLVKEMVGDV
jgi:hypothetical protein